MKGGSPLGGKGITLIELLVVLVVSGMIVAGIYRLFIAQSRAYTIQDQVAEVQQNIRGAMDLLLRDIRMAGFDDDCSSSTVTINKSSPNYEHIVYPVQNNSITINYEYYDTTALQYQRHTVAYWRDGNSRLIRQLTINNAAGPQDILLENVDAVNFTYGIDANDDDMVDNWVSSGVVGTTKVIAVRVNLTARPVQVNPDLQVLSPRTLTSTVSLRNVTLNR
jgi:type IV pilus assembly protein PilW